MAPVTQSTYQIDTPIKNVLMASSVYFMFYDLSHSLSFLINVGLEYLTLNRSAMTLSGGEAQRIRLASQIGSQLVGVLYVLDEPSIGLHPRDNTRLLKTLKSLRDIGNTVTKISLFETNKYKSIKNFYFDSVKILSNKDLDKYYTKLRSPYERIFSKTNHRVRYQGIAKN